MHGVSYTCLKSSQAVAAAMCQVCIMETMDLLILLGYENILIAEV